MRVTERNGTVTFDVKVQPRASRQRIVGEQGGRLKVTITAAPVEGAANEALILVLAEALGVPKANIEILRGQTGRKKIVRVTGVTPQAVAALAARNKE